MLAKNIIANIFGKFWVLAISILAVPIYINLLGVEAYGLVGFFTMLLATLHLLEFGLGVVVNREIAQTRGDKEKFQNTLDLIRSLEAIYWMVGLLLGLLVYFSASFLATQWLNNELLAVADIENAIKLMAMITAFQWPISLYAGCLLGLERQVLLNFLQVCFGTLRAGGAILVLWLISPTLKAFFIWQLLTSVLTVLGFAILCWRVLPHRQQLARFSVSSLRSVFHFGAGVGATSIATFLLSNLDRVVLSKTVTLTAFGYYNVANQINVSTRMISGAVFQALFPRFSSLYANKKDQELVDLFHRGSQLISFVVFPAAITLALFSEQILYIWLRNELVAHSAAMIASFLVLGSALNATLGLPFELTVARGWSMYGFYQNMVTAIVQVPIMLMLVTIYGALGAAIAWLILNIGYFFVAAPIMILKTLPKGELSIWYTEDVIKPLVVTVLVSVIMRMGLPESGSFWGLFFWIVGSWITAQLACFLVLPRMRLLMSNRFGTLWSH